MQPAAARSSRSSIIYPVAPLTSTYVQHQPQRVVYAPVSTIQTGTRTLQPSYVYSRNQKVPRQVTPMPTEGKANAWPMKNKPLKNPQFCQQQFVHPSNPIVVYKPPTSNFYPTQNQSNAPFFLASSNFPPNVYTEHFNYPNVTMLPQTFYKAPEMQQAAPVYTNQLQPQQISSYYMTTTNATNLQTVNVGPNYDLQQMKTVSAFPSNQVPVVQSVSVYPKMRMGLVVNESSNEKVDVTTGNKLVNNIVKATLSNENTWFSQSHKVLSNNLFDETSEKGPETNSQKGQCSKVQEERLSEASSASFDFTIEAEKMVSALCDVKSPDGLKKESDSATANSEKKDSKWYPEEESDGSTSNVPDYKSVATQSPETCSKETLSEHMRTTALWGCTEAETILKSPRYREDSKYTWLTNLSMATKTALTKSNASFPVFGGDRILVHDLINGLLRISNGWLALDNYLNKPYYPNLDEKYDKNLTDCFQVWESITQDLMKSIVQTVQKIEKTSTFSEPEQKQENVNLSFPGDVSMYTHCDLFDPYASHVSHQQSIYTFGLSPIQTNYSSSYFSQTPNFQYINCQQSIKESKLRTKWTISDNASTPGTSSKIDNSRKYRNSMSYTNTSFQKSLNDEFSNLKSKVLESSSFTKTKPDFNKEKEQSFTNKNPFTCGPFPVDDSTRKKTDTGYQAAPSTTDTLYYQNSVFSNSLNTNSYNFQSKVHSSEEKHPKYQKSTTDMDPTYAEKASSEFDFVPKTKMTLLSQIEPGQEEPPKNQQEMTAHLSAWFASMRNPSTENPQKEKGFRPSSHRQLDIARNALDLSRQLRMDTNNQLLTLKNMQSIQSAPWSAFSLLNGNKSTPKTPEECESSEDLRIYMKPGSYNVPKKRQKKKAKGFQSNLKNVRVKPQEFVSKEVDSVPSSLPTLSSVSTGSPNNSNNHSLSSNNSLNFSMKKEEKGQQEDDCSSSEMKDSTWKAACASAEILLEALNTSKSSGDHSKLGLGT